MVRENRIKVFSTGNLTANAAGDASYSGSSEAGNGPVNGFLHAIKYVTNPSATIKIYEAEISGANYSIELTVSGTDVVLPKAPVVNESGAAIANVYEDYPLKGNINVDFTLAGAGSTVSAELWYK